MTFQNLATRSPQLGQQARLRILLDAVLRHDQGAPVCPKCGTVQPPEVARVRAPVREPRRPFRTPMPVAAEPEEEAAPLADADEEGRGGRGSRRRGR